MKVKIAIEFDVEPLEPGEDESAEGVAEWMDEFDESVARSAASVAAYDYLSLVKVFGVTTDSAQVEVHVDGFGPCRVQLGKNHE